MRSQHSLKILSLLSCLLLSHIHAATRTFTSIEGVKIEAELISVDPLDRATIRRDDGRLFRDVPIEFFSSDDRKFIRKWRQDHLKSLNDADITEDSRVRVSVGTGRDDDFNEYGDIDDQLISYKPKLSFYNEEMQETFTDVTGTLVFIGEHVLNNRVYSVLYREEFKVDIPPKEKIEWHGKPFTSGYDPDSRGYKYEGYILTLRNKAGQIVQTKSSKSIWVDQVEAINKAELEQAFDRKFETKRPGFSSF